MGFSTSLTNQLPIKLNFHHIKSHQEDEHDISTLPWEAQMKCHADHFVATHYLDRYADPSKIVPFIPASKARSLTIYDKTITRCFANRLRQAPSSPALCKRLMTRNNWTRSTFQSINWEVPGKALDTLEKSAQTFILKLAQYHLPTHRHMQKIGQAKTDKCPACLHITETDWHILSCTRGRIHPNPH